MAIQLKLCEHKTRSADSPSVLQGCSSIGVSSDAQTTVIIETADAELAELASYVKCVYRTFVKLTGL
jgi:hypothetical protein